MGATKWIVRYAMYATPFRFHEERCIYNAITRKSLRKHPDTCVCYRLNSKALSRGNGNNLISSFSSMRGWAHKCAKRWSAD